MSRHVRRAGCHNLELGAVRRLADGAAVALEDYARALTRAARVEAIPGGAGSGISGVHVCGAAQPPAEELRRDLEAFARDLAGEREGGGLGWS